jgi:hypothetical protein
MYRWPAKRGQEAIFSEPATISATATGVCHYSDLLSLVESFMTTYAGMTSEVLGSVRVVVASVLVALFVGMGLVIMSGEALPSPSELRAVTGSVEGSVHITRKRPDFSGYHRVVLKAADGSTATITVSDSVLDDQQAASLRGRLIGAGVFPVKTAGVPHNEAFWLTEGDRQIVTYEAAARAKAQLNRNSILVGLGFVVCGLAGGVVTWRRERSWLFPPGA